MTASVGQILAFLYTQVTWRIPFPWSQHLEGGWMLEQCDSHCQQQSEILQQECDHTAGKATPHPSISAFQSSHCKCCAGNLKSLCWTKTLFFLFSILRRKKKTQNIDGHIILPRVTWDPDLFFILRNPLLLSSCRPLFSSKTNQQIFMWLYIHHISLCPPSQSQFPSVRVLAELHEHFSPSSWSLFRGNSHFSSALTCLKEDKGIETYRD